MNVLQRLLIQSEVADRRSERLRLAALVDRSEDFGPELKVVLDDEYTRTKRELADAEQRLATLVDSESDESNPGTTAR